MHVVLPGVQTYLHHPCPRRRRAQTAQAHKSCRRVVIHSQICSDLSCTPREETPRRKGAGWLLGLPLCVESSPKPLPDPPATSLFDEPTGKREIDPPTVERPGFQRGAPPLVGERAVPASGCVAIAPTTDDSSPYDASPNDERSEVRPPDPLQPPRLASACMRWPRLCFRPAPTIHEGALSFTGLPPKESVIEQPLPDLLIWPPENEPLSFLLNAPNNELRRADSNSAHAVLTQGLGRGGGGGSGGSSRVG